ncbi:hypothetical protein [Methylocystis sp.]|uniref:hypothetical protein n=1 Tax=Methylocystis sp. TaxID=1911079 RepID=UPI0025E7B68B|nr:hypothetical protein [Methylocystis sp.]
MLAAEAMILKHDGFVVEVGYEDGDQLMHFAGRDIDELKAALADTIANYGEWRQERGVEPQEAIRNQPRRPR